MPGSVAVNEVSYDPPASQPSLNEWVEVVNRSSAPVDLAGVRVADATGGTSAAVTGPLVVPPGGFAVLVANGPAFAAAFPGVVFAALAGFPTLNNSGDTVRLVLAGGDLDAVPFLASWGGTDASLERRDPNGPSTSAANFGTTTDPAFGTPGRRNALFAVDTTAPAVDAAEATGATTLDVTFSEAVTPATAQQASNYTVSGGASVASAVQTSPTTVRLALGAPLAGPAGYTLTVRGVSDAAGNVLAEARVAFFFGTFATPAPRDLVVNEVMFDPPPGQPSTNEWVEILNRSDRTFNLADLRFADATSAPLPLATSPTVLAPGAYVVAGRDAAAFAAAYPGVPFVTVAGFPTLNNDADRPALLLADGTVLDAVPYRASWGGVDASLERKDPNGPSASARNFATSTSPARATPGARNSVFALDTAGPTLVSATASPDGRVVTVVLDEPVNPAGVVASAFLVSGAVVTTATYDEAALVVTLTLAAPLAGNATVTATGLRDPLGNTTATTSTALAFTPDRTPPGIASASALTATSVRVTFTEPVTAASAAAATYTLGGGIGAATRVELEDGAAIAVVLTLGVPLAERRVSTLSVSGLVDLAGNTQSAATLRLLFGDTDTPARGDLALTEILYDPRTGDSEYLELLNTTPDRVFSLAGVTLDDGDPADADALAASPVLVLPGETAVVVRGGAAFAARFPGVAFAVLASLSLSNTGEAVVLRAGGALIDSVFYDPDWHRAELDDASGIALERRDPAGPSNASSNWSSSLDESGGTPGRANTLSIAATPVERGGGVSVTSPFAPDDGEAARITYTLDAPAALVRVRVFDGGGRLVREVEDGRLSGQTGMVEWDGTDGDRRRLRAGIYVVLLEAVDTAGGTTEAHRTVVVLARR